jgi:hypothetical protein
MANCRRCKTNVGCGCNLTLEGYCSACNYAVQQEIKQQEDANTKAD